MQYVSPQSCGSSRRHRLPAVGDELRKGNVVGVAHDTEMHDTNTTTTQAIQHPGQDLALESNHLPLPPHNIGTHSPLTSSPLQTSHNDVVYTLGTKQQEQVRVIAAVHDSADLDRAVALNVDASGNGRSAGMTDSVFLSEHIAYCQKTNWWQTPQYNQESHCSCLVKRTLSSQPISLRIQQFLQSLNYNPHPQSCYRIFILHQILYRLRNRNCITVSPTHQKRRPKGTCLLALGEAEGRAARRLLTPERRCRMAR